MTCKDCIFNEICERREDLVQLDDFTWDEYGESNEVEKYCSIFRNKADFVEVVRCKDCEHWKRVGFDNIFEKDFGECRCEFWTYNSWTDDCYKETLENDFCSNGERRKENE